MSIASRITSMENNIRNAYHGLDSIGIDTTNTNKNIENISALLDDFYDSLPKVSGTGTNISLSPTKKGRITSQINGDTFQQTYTGKNLAEFGTQKDTTKYTYESYLANNLDVTKTATGGSFYASFILHIPSAGTYKFKGNILYDSQQIYIYSDQLWGTQVKNFSVPVGEIVYSTTFDTAGDYVLGLYGSATRSYGVKDFMLIPNSASDGYEPYVGGTASPNPEFPQNIQSVTGLQKINVIGGNIFDGSVGGSAGQYLTNTGTVATGGENLRYSDYIQISNNTNLLYVTGILSDYLMNTPAICFYDNNKTFISGETYNNQLTATFIVPTNAKYFRTSYRNIYSNFSVQEKNIYDINLGDIHLYEDDQIIGTPDNWSIKHIMGERVFDGRENWSASSLSVTGYKSFYTSNSHDEYELAYCNYFTKGTYQDWINLRQDNFFELASGSIGFRINETIVNNLANWKTWLSTNNTKVVYNLKTPTTEPITNTELISQLNAFYYAKSKQGQTNISVEGNLPMILDVSALKYTE